MDVEQALILAAGNGSRLQPALEHVPKPLMSVGGLPLLQRVILGARHAGINEFVIVVGHKGQAVKNYFAQHPIAGVTLQWVDNDEYEKANGISVLKARPELREPFLLLMADHIFEPDTARRLLQQPLVEGEIILAVDRKVGQIFDIEDATKVRLLGDRVTDIGKTLSGYDAVDTGMFLCSLALLDALQASLVAGDCALSDGVRHLAQQGCVRAFDVRNALWCDVDTPAAVRHAETLLRERLNSTLETMLSPSPTNYAANAMR